MRAPRIVTSSMRPADLRLLLLLFVVSALCALLLVDWARAPMERLGVGDVAPRTVEAPTDFSYQDFAARERRQQEARAAVLPVFVQRASLGEEIGRRVDAAYEAGRRALPEGWEPGNPLATEAMEAARTEFRKALGSHVPNTDLAPLLLAGFPVEAAQFSRTLLARGMRGYIALDVTSVPDGKVRVVEVRGLAREEVVVDARNRVVSVEEAHQRVSLGLVEASGARPDWADAAARVARASIRPNLEYDGLETERRREIAGADVPMETISVKRGEILFRQGDVLNEVHILRYQALQSLRQDGTKPLEVAALAAFLAVVLLTLYTFTAAILVG